MLRLLADTVAGTLGKEPVPEPSIRHTEQLLHKSFISFDISHLSPPERKSQETNKNEDISNIERTCIHGVAKIVQGKTANRPVCHAQHCLRERLVL